MSTHLLSRGALHYDMGLADWLAHGWYLLTSPAYRKSVAALKRAFNTTEPRPADLELWDHHDR